MCSQTLQRLVYPFVTVVFFAACTTNLHSKTLSTGVLNEAYEDSFFVDDDTWALWNSDTALLVSGGSLPPGIQLTGSGELFGSPTAVGDFNFEVTAYTFNDDADVHKDWEWFTLFVTELSTNGLCPRPDNETVTELYICLGEVSLENLARNEEFTLDINYFINLSLAGEYDVGQVDFSVFFDPATFTPVADKLNSQILRETATRTDATVLFEDSGTGELRVIVTAESQNLHKSGRFIDLPFIAVSDLVANTHDFTIVVNSASSRSNAALPPLIEIDGFLNITVGEYESEESQEVGEEI